MKFLSGYRAEERKGKQAREQGSLFLTEKGKNRKLRLERGLVLINTLQ